MIEALLHGKLSREQENMEDILTSNVFGLFQYASPEEGVLRFLACARTIDGERPIDQLAHPSKSGPFAVKYLFWPNWPRCQPDVALQIRATDGHRFLVCIEVKYLSGKSSERDEIEASPIRDQLARQWADVAEESRREDARPLLVYLTTDVVCPRAEIESSIAEWHSKKRHVAGLPDPAIYWLTWRYLPRLFSEKPSRPLHDIALVAKRLGLTFYEGVTPVNPIRTDWTFTL